MVAVVGVPEEEAEAVVAEGGEGTASAGVAAILIRRAAH